MTSRHKTSSSPQGGPASPTMRYGDSYNNNYTRIGANGDDDDDDDPDAQDIAFPDNKTAKAPRLLDRIGFWVLTFVFCVFSVAMVLLFAVVFGSLWVDQDKRITELRKELLQAIADSEARTCEKIEVVANRTTRIERVLAKGPFQPLAEKAEPDGYAPLDDLAIVPDVHLPAKLLNAMFLGNEGGGCWDPRTNVPLLKSNQMCSVGEYYISNNTGTSVLDSFGGVSDPWQLGDALVCTGDIGWKRVRDIPRVRTWNGLSGDVMAFLGTLINVDESGGGTGDALVLHFDNIWRPTADCCAAAVGHAPGFLAMLAGHNQAPDDDDDTNSNLRGMFCFERRWQSVDFVTTGSFPVGTTQPVLGGAFWNPNDPNFVHIPAILEKDGPFFGSGTYTVGETGWYHVASKIRLNDAGSRFFGMRLFRLNTGLEAIYQQDQTEESIGGRLSPILTIEGTFAFCEGEVLQMQFFHTADDDDVGDQECLIENPSGPFDNIFDAPPNAGGMYWHMWKVPDILMPAIQFCSGFNLKKRDHNEEPIVYPTTWEDPALVYRLNMRRWERNTAFYNQQCEGPINCTHYKPGPKPEMPSFMKPPPPPPPPDPDPETNTTTNDNDK